MIFFEKQKIADNLKEAAIEKAEAIIKKFYRKKPKKRVRL